MDIKEFKERVFSLSHRIYPMVVRLLGNESDAKDAIQEVMLKLWEQRNKLRHHPNVKGYVYLTAKNHCLDQLKKSKPKHVSKTLIQEELIHIDQQELEHAELIKHIQSILKKCPIKHNDILILRDVDRMTYEEIAGLMDLKVTYVRVIISRVRKYVQQELIKLYEYEYGGR